MAGRSSKPIIVNGIEYPRVKDAVKTLNISYWTLYQKIQAGEAQFAPPKRVLVRSDGKTYNSIPEAAKDNFLVYQSIQSAMIRGYRSGGYYWEWREVEQKELKAG